MVNRLLYLEDDPALAHVTSRALARGGFDVCHCDSLAGLRMAVAEGHYSHALLDLKIGQDNSLELIEELKQAGIDTIVMLTGYGSIRTAVQAMKLGAVNFLSKPCSAQEIIAALLGEEEGVAAQPDELAKPSLRSVEWETIQQALEENNGNISATAKQLKMHRRTLQRKLQKRYLPD
ncbi:response regulator transcription factor [Halioxenophilus sp. WMMB6]|uniref:response regulator transcription factor n=1 Tax=Halioxenophilus sp. WMMB6 TaxID=3073815 RepID=UPI00295EE139|nr:response regulator [Halioxenophilus sp. WMMB6]